MSVLELKKDFYWCGVRDKDLRVFDIIMSTEFGTSYNAYMLKSEGKTVLFETVKDKFYDEYYANISAFTSISDIDYIVMNHTEPDHAGSIAKLLALNPSIEIIGTSAAINFLGEIINTPFKSIVVSNGQELKVGDKTLKFFVLPNLHWPDTMYTYIMDDKTLVTCDSFGAHYCWGGILSSKIVDKSGYARAEKYYFDNIIAPFKRPFMTNAIAVVKSLDIDMICTGHGAVHDSGIPELLARYAQWCDAGVKFDNTTIVIPYVSAYGYTKSLAEAIAEGITVQGADAMLYDMVTADKDEVLTAINAAHGVLFGTPTILGDALKPIWELLTSIYKPISGKKIASAFGSYGWSGEGVPNIIARLKQLNWDVEESYRVRFKPSDIELLKARSFGANFATKVINAKK